MRIFNDVDPTTNPFNDFMKNYGMWIAIGIAVLVLLIVLILFLASSKHKSIKQVQKPVISSFSNEDVVKALGGKENILDSSLNGSRISISLKDTSIVDEASLKQNSVKSIIKMSNKITILVEGDSKEFFTRVF